MTCHVCGNRRFSRRWWEIRIEDSRHEGDTTTMKVSNYWVCGKHAEVTLPSGSTLRRPEAT